MDTGNGFRDQSHYNNILYSVAGLVAETIGKSSWEDLTVKNIFEPIGMLNTSFFHLINPTTDDTVLIYVPVMEHFIHLEHYAYT